MITSGMYIFLIISCILSLIFSLSSIILGTWCVVKVLSTEKSTHQIQYMPTEEALSSNIGQDWATSEKSLKEQYDLDKEDLEVDMPEFLPGDEDKKVRSF